MTESLDEMTSRYGRELHTSDMRLGAVWVEGHNGIRWRVVEHCPHIVDGRELPIHSRVTLAVMDNPGVPGYRGRQEQTVTFGMGPSRCLDGPRADLSPATWFVHVRSTWETVVGPADWSTHDWHAEPDAEWGRWDLTLTNRDELIDELGGRTPDDPGSDVMLFDTPTGRTLVVPLGCSLVLRVVSGWSVEDCHGQVVNDD